MTKLKFTHPNGAPEGHEWQTRGGNSVEIWRSDVGFNGNRILGVYECNGRWFSADWEPDGGSLQGEHLRLIDKPQTITLWVNIYGRKRWIFCSHKTRAGADRHATDDRIACLKITFTPGEGLEDE